MSHEPSSEDAADVLVVSRQCRACTALFVIFFIAAFIDNVRTVEGNLRPWRVNDPSSPVFARVTLSAADLALAMFTTSCLRVASLTTCMHRILLYACFTQADFNLAEIISAATFSTISSISPNPILRVGYLMLRVLDISVIVLIARDMPAADREQKRRIEWGGSCSMIRVH